MTAEEARMAIHLLAPAPIHLCTYPPIHPATQADVYEELSNPWGEAMQCSDEMEQLSARPRGSNPKLATTQPL
eukprot:scaffold5041_cov85-Phaeocystis_antarctica.AAC.3